MKKVVSENDLSVIEDGEIVSYIKGLLQILTEAYKDFCPNRSIEAIGTIFVIEQESDFDNFRGFGLSSAIRKSDFEWIVDIENGYFNGCIVIDTDFAINIIGKKEFFRNITEGLI